MGANVAFDPWTFSEVYFDLDPSTSGDDTFRRVIKTETFNVAISADAENLYGQAFKFSYDPTKLTLNSTTFSTPWTGGIKWELPAPRWPGGRGGGLLLQPNQRGRLGRRNDCHFQFYANTAVTRSSMSSSTTR